MRLAILAGLLTFIAATCRADHLGEFLLFPDITTVARSHDAQNTDLKKNNIVPAVDLFYALDHEHLRFLGEYLVDKDDHALERFQVGVRIGEPTIWLGRFHNPIGYWNTQYHHGAYLQTSASRPGIVAFEGGDGPLPMHLTGVLAEGIHEFGKAGIHYTLAAGLGPQLKKELAPFDVLDPDGSHRFGSTLRFSYQPVSYGLDDIGFSLSYTKIPADTLDLRSVRQSIAGVFGNWQFGELRALAELLYVRNRMAFTTENISKEFVNGYAQLEWKLNEKWTPFGRVERTFVDREDQYLDTFSRVVRDRFLIGARYDFYRNMALKLEVSRDKLEEKRFSQVMLQWSAVFP